MSSLRSIPVIAIVLLVIGLVIGGSGGYFLSNSSSQSKVRGFEDQIADLSEEISSLSGTITGLEDDKSSLTSQISDYEDQVLEIQGQISTLEDEKDNLESYISELEETITDYEEIVRSLDGQISLLEDQIALLISDLSLAQQTISAHDEVVAALESEMELLRALVKTYLPDKFTIGLTAADSGSFTRVQAVANISQVEINEYCVAQKIPFTFEFVVYNNWGDSDEAVENTIRFEREGVDLLVGHETSTECSLSLNYVNTHGMVMLSPSARDRSLSIAGDSFYRLCPTDLLQAEVIAEMLSSFGIEAVIVFQRGDDWADGIYEAFETDFEEKGGVIYERIRYKTDATTYVAYMNSAESVAKNALSEYGEGRVAVLLLSKTEAAKIVDTSAVFPTLYDLRWFGSENISNATSIFKSKASAADHVKVFGPVLAQESNAKYESFKEKYYSRTNASPSFYVSAMYDACWLYALTVIDTWTTNTTFVRPALEEITDIYQGASGWCSFNENGDRVKAYYEIWGYALEEDTLTTMKYGYYNPSNGQVTWLPSAEIYLPE